MDINDVKFRKIVGSRIKSERTEMGYSQGDLMEALYLSRDSRQTVANWESGKTLPSIDHLLKMCGLFKCELGYLLGEGGYEGKTRAKTDIQMITGLSIKAIENICMLKELDDLPPKPGQLNILNSLLENMVDFSLFLAKIKLYLREANKKTFKEAGANKSFYESELKKMGFVVTTPEEFSRVKFEDSVGILKIMLDKIVVEQKKEE